MQTDIANELAAKEAEHDELHLRGLTKDRLISHPKNISNICKLIKCILQEYFHETA